MANTGETVGGCTVQFPRAGSTYRTFLASTVPDEVTFYCLPCPTGYAEIVLCSSKVGLVHKYSICTADLAPLLERYRMPVLVKYHPPCASDLPYKQEVPPPRFFFFFDISILQNVIRSWEVLPCHLPQNRFFPSLLRFSLSFL